MLPTFSTGNLVPFDFGVVVFVDGGNAVRVGGLSRPGVAVGWRRAFIFSACVIAGEDDAVLDIFGVSAMAPGNGGDGFKIVSIGDFVFPVVFVDLFDCVICVGV